MDRREFDDAEISKRALDVIPAVLLVVDDDVRLVYANSFGKSLIGENYPQALNRRTGDILECSHSSEGPEGCGSSPACRACLIRNSVGKVFADGKTIRGETSMVVGGGKKTVLSVLLTVAPVEIGGKVFAMLYLEDIGELVELRKLIPVCMKCGKVRKSDGKWQRVEEYLGENMGLDMSHGLCDECLDKYYPEK